MISGKELWLAAHEQLIEEYLDEHPEASFGEASERTADKASDRAADNLAAMIDAAMDAMEGYER